MTKPTLDEIVHKMKLQTTTESDVLRVEVLREIIYKKAEKMLVFGKVIPTVNMPQPDIRFEYPSTISVVGPIAPEAKAPTDVITWTKVDVSLYDKYEGRFVITDMAKAVEWKRQEQFRRGVQRLAEDMAQKEDAEIAAAVDAAAGDTVAVSTAWNASGADPAADMASAIKKILAAPDITIDDMKNIYFILPVDAYAEIMKLTEINNIRTSLLQWMNQTYGVKFLPTKTLTDTGYAIIGGQDTGRHYVWKPPDIPLVEQGREEGVGDFYVVRRFFKTYIIPDDASVTTTKRICKLTGLIA